MDFFVWQRTCVDDAGNVLASASVTVTDAVSGALATLYSDEGSTGIGNPITADEDGFVQFYVKAGFYNITATSGGSSRTWTKEAIGAPHKRTPAEISAGVTPVDYRYPELYVLRYGANTTPGTTDMLTAIQNAINVAEQKGGGFVILPGERLAVSGAIEITTGVILQGQGREVTELYLLDSSDTDVIRTKDFDDQTGQNLWVISDGIHYAFGLRDLKINGNQAGQTDTSKYGLKIYGNGYFIENVIIEDTKGGAFYTEAGAKTSGGSDYRPVEARINNLSIKRPGTNAVVNRGPHDARWDEIYIAEAGYHSGAGDGWTNEFLANTYSGTCDIGFMHVYSCRGTGVVLNEAVRIQHLLSESNWDAGLEVGALADGTLISQGYLFNNNAGGSSAGDDPAMTVAASECQFNNFRIRDQNDGGGVVISASNNTFNNLWVDGLTGTQVGVDVDANATTINGLHVQGYSGTGGIGLRTANSGALLGTVIDGYLSDCTTLWNNVTASTVGSIKLRGLFTASTQAGFSGVAPSTTWTETWDVVFRDSSLNYYKSRNKLEVSTTVDLTSTSEQTWTINHEMLTTPRPQDIRMSLNLGVTAEQDFVVAYMGPSTITSTQITFEFKLSTASATGGADARLYAEVNLT